MTNLEKQLTDILNGPISALGYEFIGLEFNYPINSILRIYIDNKIGINIDNCTEVSYQVSAILDVEDPISIPYILEVSSPGLDRPLFKLAHYEKFIDHEVNLILKVTINNCRKFKGVIHSVRDQCIVLNVQGEKKRFVLNNILKANLIPKFKFL
ncbi:ribosome maturation factor [Candidatus Photodesmus katoptron]|uniref:Ribosome maturation factor RimP n=1 Tax=Candidatus Photodesmus katoptron Akat1 TaxID=1236703 RepID=S3E0Z6_9GAMM|nr:ribosome maturation factor RimP [Candidatus Photodesmus katoptron]EPE37831.1 hypothetical protein O1U_0293 [Candidatus Photodesmus katoptron Akat1]KEY90450.1 ribosome maturation factor [Candidatus Photodesmus katoptron]